MKQGLKKITAMWTAVLNQQGKNAKQQAVLQSLKDFYSSSRSQLQKDLDNDDYDDEDLLRRNIKIYSDLIELIEDRSFHDKSDFENGAKKLSSLYLYYENKYNQELEYRNEEQRRNYIETILAPIVFIEEFFEELE